MWCVRQFGMRSMAAEPVRGLRHFRMKRCFCFASRPPIRTVAVIGGGISGLCCAQRLAAEQNYQVTVFDKGRLRPGGRCSSRRAWDTPASLTKEKAQRGNGLLSKYTFDHAVQVISCPTMTRHKPFLQYLDRLEKEGILTPFPKDSLFDSRAYIKFAPINNLKYYYGTAEGGGIGGIATSMVKESRFDLKQNVFVSPEHGVKYMEDENKWLVSGSHDGKPETTYGVYDALVIAHSGMGAHQLCNVTPCETIAYRMKVQFEPKLMGGVGSCLSLSSIYSLTFAIPAKDSPLSAALPSSFLSGFVREHPVFRFISCQTRKYGAYDDSVEVWTVLSSGAFGKKHASPLHESVVSRKMVTKVSRMLLWAVEEFISGRKTRRPGDPEYEIKPGFPPPSDLELLVLDQDLQWWPEAVPMNFYDVVDRRTPACFLYDSEYRIGVCGDWLVEANVAGAWTSGHRLAKHIVIIGSSIEPPHVYGSFRRSVLTATTGIGMLPMESKK
jgi:predicted NAD/FAD-dependent oxidoreductase